MGGSTGRGEEGRLRRMEGRREEVGRTGEREDQRKDRSNDSLSAPDTQGPILSPDIVLHWLSQTHLPQLALRQGCLSSSNFAKAPELLLLSVLSALCVLVVPGPALLTGNILTGNIGQIFLIP